MRGIHIFGLTFITTKGFKKQLYEAWQDGFEHCKLLRNPASDDLAKPLKNPFQTSKTKKS